MKILVAPNSMKGSLNAFEFADTIENNIKYANSKAKKEENKTVNLPVYSPKYKTHPTYRAYNNVRMCPSFKKAFNNTNPVI